MIKQTFTQLVLLLFFVSGISAQTSSKLDLHTLLRLKKGEVRNESMHLLVKGELSSIKRLTKQYGGNFKYGHHNIASVEIPEKNLLAFSNEDAIEEIENVNTYGTLLMDTARLRNNIENVHNGLAPLSHDYKGRGVIIGIIDGGIYWQHMDFKRADSSTRIRYIWDEGVTGANKPLPYNYGNEWNWFDMDNNNCTHAPPLSICADSSHGTCVAGVAAGNGNSFANDTTGLAGKYTGAAPESELIVVRVDVCAPNFATHIADAVDYIFKKADALGKPCVINTSIGQYMGSHDGQDLTTELIEFLLEERNGRALVAAAGNAGNTFYHLGYDIPVDSAFTLFNYNGKTDEVYFDWWADTVNFKNARFAIGCNDTAGVDLGRTSYFKVIPDFNPSPGNAVAITRSLFDYNNTLLLGQINLQVTLTRGRYHCEALISPTDTNYMWRLQTKGAGKFDLWSSKRLTSGSDMVSSLFNLSVLDSVYRFPDFDKTITSSWQCSDKVITVGNYSNRAGYLNKDSNYVDLVNIFPLGEIVGSRYVTSSLGPTRDGRTKPDIMATGNTITCTGDKNVINQLLTQNDTVKIALGKKHLANGGTSMAAAIVSGVAALYLEKRPTANYDEIKTALICTAVKDSFTGATVNNEYGNGKVNAFAALTQSGCITFGATDTACINYNPLANVDSGVCVLKVYGCIDSTADNYNPLANVSDGSCTYTGIKNVFTGKVLVIPNPFTEQTTFVIDGLSFEQGEIKIYNQMAQVVDGIKLNSGRTTYTYNSHQLSKGVYYYMLNADGKNLKTGKLVIE